MKQEKVMRLKRVLRQLNKSGDKLDDKRVRAEAYKQSIIKEQEAIIRKAESVVNKINKGLEALKARLQPYLDKGIFNEAYYDLRDRYADLLVERQQLLKTISVCEESITGAKLHNIGDEYVGGGNK